jgi:hypothetical protein
MTPASAPQDAEISSTPGAAHTLMRRGVSGFGGGAPRPVKEVLRPPAGTDAGFFVAQDAPRTDPDSTTAGNPGLLSETARRIDVMPTITAKDGTEIFYKDWGSGQPIVFSHGWPLSADDWDVQMLFFQSHGFRVIAHDRRGHGRSSQVGDGHDMDHYADDRVPRTH